MTIQRFWIWASYFLLAAAPGCWYPVLSNILKAEGKADSIIPIFALFGTVSLLSPLLVGAQADRRYSAEKVVAFILMGGAPILWLAFHALGAGWGMAWFMGLMLVNAVISGPAWHLLNAVALSNLPDAKRHFGFVRVGATLGWMAAGVLVSQLGVDASPDTGKLAAGVRILAGLACLMLPHTPPKAGRGKGLRELLGLDALKLLRQRSVSVYLITGFLFAIPMASLYIHTPLFFGALGLKEIGQTMAVGQVTEFVAMLAMGMVLASLRLKWVFLLALIFGGGRCLLCYLGAELGSLTWGIVGVALHGVCWTLFFEAGRVFIHQRAGEKMRAQAQALLGIVLGVGNVIGILFIWQLHRLTVGDVNQGAATLAGWSNYWGILTLASAICIAVMAVGYRGGDGKAEGIG